MKIKKGFTLIELMVAMAIISVLSVLIIAAIQAAKKTANDTKRRSDLKTIQVAMIAYNTRNKNWIQSGSGCGYGGNGTGYFNLNNGGSYPNSISECLVPDFLSTEVKDPSGGTGSPMTTPTNSSFAYMKYNCTTSGQTKAIMFAKLETIDQSTTATDSACPGSSTIENLDANYGMNYYLEM